MHKLNFVLFLCGVNLIGLSLEMTLVWVFNDPEGSFTHWSAFPKKETEEKKKERKPNLSVHVTKKAQTKIIEKLNLSHT